MKKVGIVFANDINPTAMEFVKSNLESVFSDYIQFNLYYFDHFDDSTILTDDAYLISSEVPFQLLKKYVSDYTCIFDLERSLPKEALASILQIPEGTDVLVVNDGYDSAKEVISEYSSLGAGHINMVPYDSRLKDSDAYSHFSIALTPGEADLVPSHIEEIIDIGYRKISFSTMYLLMKTLDLDFSIINRNLFRHIQTITEPNTALHDNYIFGYLKGELLNKIADTDNKALLLIDRYFQPIFANKQARTLFQISSDKNIHIKDYIPQDFLNEQETRSSVITLHGIEYYYDRFTFSIMDEPVGYFIRFQEKSAFDTAASKNIKKGYIARHQFRDIVYQSEIMDDLILKANRIATSDFTVLLIGESGTGKELIAQSIHNASFRNNMPFVAINCAALPETLLESELFGYDAGAFTGATSKGKQGLFEQANHGTIFLDEIGDISPKLQAQLLRVIQEKQIMHIGGDRLIDIDVRLITATNKDLSVAVKKGVFRQDLYFRLNVLTFQIPPLRRRKEDILLLMEHFLGSDYQSLSPKERQILMSYEWPGNIREIENIAVYFRAFNCLPEYLLNDSFITKDNLFPDDKISLSTEQALLKIISAGSSAAHGVGRSAMIRLLQRNGIHISDNRLRKILSSLKSRGYIQIQKGRGGTMITEKGIEVLNAEQEHS